jgi:hypothetical protein
MKNITILFLFWVFTCSCSDKREKIGEEVYLKIVQYQKTNGHLPDNLNDIGVEEKMEGPIYYQKQTDSTFQIYYGGELGESIVFDPLTKKWKSDKQ